MTTLWKRIRRMLLWLSVLSFAAGLTAFFGPRTYANWRVNDDIYTLEQAPQRPVAIVFGARVLASGRLSTMLADRVRTAADLYHAGKVEVLLLSGDNSSPNYNEPAAMRRYALSLGVADEDIVLDYAGLRTYDTCYRARDVFKVKSAILVTQDFHLTRALLICDELGIDAVGVAADYHRPNGYRSEGWSQFREYPATALAVVDLLVGREPTYLGEPLPIVLEERMLQD